MIAEYWRTLQSEGVARRTHEPWTKDAVKDIVRRGRFYLGKVVYHRGEGEREGRHPAILDQAAWAAGRKAINARGREWTYYLGRDCGRKALPASAADAAVLALLRQMILPPDVIEAGREELRRRLALP